MVVNRAGVRARRTRSFRARFAIRKAACSASSRCSGPRPRKTSSARDVRILEFVSRKAVAILGNEYDSLTGLPNRLIFERRAQRALDRAAHGGAVCRHRQARDDQRSIRLEAGDEVIQRVGTLVQHAAGADALGQPPRRRPVRRGAAGDARPRSEASVAARSSPQ